jgi:lipoprotein-releasing system permease protein
MNTNIFIALRHLIVRRKQSLVALLGVAISIAMYILMSGIMTGVNKVLDNSIFANTPHIRLYHEVNADEPSIIETSNLADTSTWVHVAHQRPGRRLLYFQDGKAVADNLRRRPEVASVSPQLSSNVLFNYGAVQISGQVLGVEIESEDRMFNLKRKLATGSLEDLRRYPNGVLMGVGLAKKLNIKTGDNVAITTPSGQVLPLKVVGLFKMGIGPIDNSRCYADLSTAQKILQRPPGYITDISIKLHDPQLAMSLAALFSQMFDCKTEDWAQANAIMLQGQSIRNAMTYMVALTLLVVSGFGIYNIMNMTISNKMKDIAILKATGFSGTDTIRIFLYQAIIIGFLGGLLGVGLGFLSSYGVSRLPFDGGEFLEITKFPMNFDPVVYVFAVIFAFITTMIAGYFPARKAARVDPIVILRG